ncbi:MAG: hypothetical protein KGQ36_05355 [Rickettsiales bacterium]|nr:hypothetical protein [Rickettsiales bacterium]
MKKFFLIFLIIIIVPKVVFAASVKDGFYVGVDASKNNETIGKLDNSKANVSEQDRYYGYKFSDGGFFVAPEVSSDKASYNSLNKSNVYNQSQASNKINAPSAATNYNLKANVGYDFNKMFSGFLTYDVAKFSYNANQGTAGVNASSALGNSSIGIGSQINFSSDFGVKVQYTQQKFDGNTASGGQIRSDIIKVGTVYSF